MNTILVKNTDFRLGDYSCTWRKKEVVIRKGQSVTIPADLKTYLDRTFPGRFTEVEPMEAEQCQVTTPKVTK